MKNIIKITPMRQLKALSYFLFHIVLYAATFIYLKFDTDFFVIFGPMTVLLVLPALFLHFEYIYRNKKEEYELCGDKIIRRKENNEFIYNKEDISKITVFVCPNYFRNGIYVTAFENYHFARIVLNTGENMYLTSLLAPGGIDKALSIYLKDIPYRKENRLFSTTLY
jgi:hypothetical protein